MKTWKHLRSHPELLPRYIIRGKIYKAIRDFFSRKDFLEVETPTLVPVPSNEPYLEVFQTLLVNEKLESKNAYLISSPEYSMKKLLAAYIPNVFQLARCFRNAEGRSRLHNPEFTMLEWYRSQATYQDIMADCEQLLLAIGQAVSKNSSLTYQNNSIDLSSPWERLSVAEAFRRFANVDVFELFESHHFLSIAKAKNYSVSREATAEQVYHQIFLNEIEPKLGFSKPTILYDYPYHLSSYAKVSKTDPRVVERFEFYILGIELGNAFSELIDPKEQKKRLLEDAEERHRVGKSDLPIDEEFIEALTLGLPKCAGIAVGVDRLVMLFANASSIQETMFFPGDELFP